MVDPSLRNQFLITDFYAPAIQMRRVTQSDTEVSSSDDATCNPEDDNRVEDTNENRDNQDFSTTNDNRDTEVSSSDDDSDQDFPPTTLCMDEFDRWLLSDKHPNTNNTTTWCTVWWKSVE